MKILAIILLCFIYVPDRSNVLEGAHINNNYNIVIAELKRREGLKLVKYICSGGHRTIGFGQTRCKSRKITEVRANEMLNKSFKEHYQRAQKEFPGLSDNKYLAIALLTYNVGWQKLRSFRLYHQMKKDSIRITEWAQIRFYRVKGKLVESENLKQARLFELKLYNL